MKVRLAPLDTHCSGCLEYEDVACIEVTDGKITLISEDCVEGGNVEFRVGDFHVWAYEEGDNEA